MKKVIFAVSLLSLGFVACKKDKNEEVTPTKENLTGSYKITGMTVAGVNVWNNSNESVNWFDPCERDDIFTLKSDMTGELTDAGTKCDPTTASTGTWSLTGSTVVVSGMGSVDIEGTIKSWNGKDMVVEDVDQGAVGTITLQKQ